MHSIHIPWPNLRLYARNCGEVDPYDSQNAAIFRGEEAFAPDVVGWQRWSKPSPEPRLDAGFQAVLLDSIGANAPQINALVRELARRIGDSFDKAPVLVAVLRAGVPICALLAPLLKKHFGEDVPMCAFSLFYGLGWDEVALEQIVADFPDRPLLFVDGWTSGGGVATQLNQSFQQWRSKGKRDFTEGRGPQFAVLCDPRGKATFSAVRGDHFVPSAAFTAPETLGFSRGFAFESGELFGVYAFPTRFQKPEWIAAWMEILNAPSMPLPCDNSTGNQMAPAGLRVDLNEVTRALINRDPLEIWLRADEVSAQQSLAPLLYLAQLRGVPVRFSRHELDEWNTAALARMK
ncbi:hypothetical protein IAD21_04139 [Abditibacteriota bacterium]|nr:hypothetical protein IAD21_04139 [Abditibacteriota bacterium]